MKNKVILAVFAIFSLTACSKSALDDNGGGASGTAIVIPASFVPSTIITSFNNNFREGTELEWQRNNSSFTSQFNLGNQRHYAPALMTGSSVFTQYYLP